MKHTARSHALLDEAIALVRYHQTAQSVERRRMRRAGVSPCATCGGVHADAFIWNGITRNWHEKL